MTVTSRCYTFVLHSEYVFRCTALRLQRCGSFVQRPNHISLASNSLKDWHNHQRVAMGRGAMLVQLDSWLAGVANRLYTSILRQGKAQARGKLPGGRAARPAAKMAARLHLEISQKCGQQRKAWVGSTWVVCWVGGWMGGWVQEWVGVQTKWGEGQARGGAAPVRAVQNCRKLSREAARQLSKPRSQPAEPNSARPSRGPKAL